MQRAYLFVESSGPLVFDGLKAVCWFINMSSSITSPRIINVTPGVLYSFVFTQNRVGGHTMNWPGSVINAAQIDPTPLSTTTMTFIADIDSDLYPNISPTWSNTGAQP
jgi:hypothetical protein